MVDTLKHFKLSDWLCLLSWALFMVGLAFGPEDYTDDYAYGWTIHDLYDAVYLTVALLIAFTTCSSHAANGLTSMLFVVTYCGLMSLWGLCSIEHSLWQQTTFMTLSVATMASAFIINRFGGDSQNESSSR